MPHFNTDHPHAWAFAKQCFRVGLVPNIPPMLVESFISMESNKPYMFQRILKLPEQKVVFDFDAANPVHERWATLSWSVGCWGPAPPTCDIDDPLYIKWAVGEVRDGLAKLRLLYNITRGTKSSDDNALKPKTNTAPKEVGADQVIDSAASNQVHEKEKDTAEDQKSKHNKQQSRSIGSNTTIDKDDGASRDTSSLEAAAVQLAGSTGSNPIETSGAPSAKPDSNTVNEAFENSLKQYVEQEGKNLFRCKVPDHLLCYRIFKDEHFWRKHVEKRHGVFLESIQKDFELTQEQNGRHRVATGPISDLRADEITPGKAAFTLGSAETSGSQPLQKIQKDIQANRVTQHPKEHSGSCGATVKPHVHFEPHIIASHEKATIAVDAASVDSDSDEDLPVRPPKRRKLQRRLPLGDVTEESNGDGELKNKPLTKESAVLAGSTSSGSKSMNGRSPIKSLADRIKERHRRQIEKPEATTKLNRNLHADESALCKDAAIKPKRKHVQSAEDMSRASNNHRANEDTRSIESDDGDDTPLVVQRANSNPIAALQKRIESPAAMMISPPKATKKDAEADPRQVRADESIGVVNSRELLPSDLVHLQDLFKHSKDIGYSRKELLTAVFESWDTSTPLGERPAAPRIFQITSDMNRVLAGVFRRDCPVALAAGQPRLTRGRLEEATKAHKKGEPVFYYGATAHGLPIWDYKDSNGMPVDKSDVSEKTGAVEAATTEIKEKWRIWAEPRVKQHDFDVLVWMVRQRLSLWYCENGITWGDGVPLYNEVESSKFEKWDFEVWSRSDGRNTGKV